MNLGAMLHVNGKLEEAEQSYLEALRIRPDEQVGHDGLQPHEPSDFGGWENGLGRREVHQRLCRIWRYRLLLVD